MEGINIDDVDNVDEIDIVDDDMELARIPRQIYVRANHFDEYGEAEFIQRFRLGKLTTLHVLEQIEHQLEYIYDKNNSVTPINQLLLTLRVYATGGHLISIGDFINCDKSTVSRIVAKVTRVISSLYKRYIRLPSNNEEVLKRQNEFYEVAGFPKVMGVIDGSHIRMLSQGGDDAEIFRNRKGYFSINIQAVSTANLLFQDIVARWPGSTHDSTIFNNSRVKYRFENGDFGNSLLLGDSGYTNRQYLLTPFLNPRNNAEQQYNRCHIQTRVKVEHLFGVWKRRFPLMAYGCRLKLSTTLQTIVATAILHNIARLRGEPEPPAENAEILHELQQLILNGDIPDVPNQQNVGFDQRRAVVEDYFDRL